MVILSAMLIYSLMVSDIDERTYEMAMLRALGLRSSSIIMLILIQSLIFGIPGVTIGLFVSALLNVGVRYFIFTYTVSYTSYFLSTFAVIFGVGIGILMPILSNLLTIKKAMAKKIRDSLDIFHNSVNETVVSVIKLEQYGISLFELGLGIALTVVGVMTYYLAPAAFIFDKLEIFFLILNLILVCMIIGLCFL